MALEFAELALKTGLILRIEAELGEYLRDSGGRVSFVPEMFY